MLASTVGILEAKGLNLDGSCLGSRQDLARIRDSAHLFPVNAHKKTPLGE